MTFIIDPLNSRRVNLHSSDGLNILKKYIKTFQLGGSDSSDLENPFLTKEQKDEIAANIENIPTDSDESIENPFVYEPKPIPESVKLYYENISNLFMDLLRNKVKLPNHEQGTEFEIENMEQVKEYFTNMNKLLDEGEYIVGAFLYPTFLSEILRIPSFYKTSKSKYPNLTFREGETSRAIVYNLTESPVKLAIAGTFITNKLKIISFNEYPNIIHKKVNIDLTLNEIKLINHMISMLNGQSIPLFGKGRGYEMGYNKMNRNYHHYGLFLNDNEKIDIIPLLKNYEKIGSGGPGAKWPVINSKNLMNTENLILPFVEFIKSLRETEHLPSDYGKDYIQKLSNHMFSVFYNTTLYDQTSRRVLNWQDWTLEKSLKLPNRKELFYIVNYSDIYELFMNLNELIKEDEYIIAMSGEIVDFTPEMFKLLGKWGSKPYTFSRWKWNNINDYKYILKPGFFIVTNKFNIVSVKVDGQIEIIENNISLNESAIILINALFSDIIYFDNYVLLPNHKQTGNTYKLLSKLKYPYTDRHGIQMASKSPYKFVLQSPITLQEFLNNSDGIQLIKPGLRIEKSPSLSFKKEYLFNLIDLIKKCLMENQDIRTNPFKAVGTKYESHNPNIKSKIDEGNGGAKMLLEDNSKYKFIEENKPNWPDIKSSKIYHFRNIQRGEKDLRYPREAARKKFIPEGMNHPGALNMTKEELEDKWSKWENFVITGNLVDINRYIRWGNYLYVTLSEGQMGIYISYDGKSYRPERIVIDETGYSSSVVDLTLAKKIGSGTVQLKYVGKWVEK